MPSFSARITAGATLQPWLDPAPADLASRINPTARRGHKRRVGAVGTEVTVTATVDGNAAPLDSALDGKLFFGFFAEYPGLAPALSSPAGQSSVQRFTPNALGHYTFVLRRHDRGAVFLHLDVVD